VKGELKTAFALFLIGTALSCICTGRWLLNGEMNIMRALASFQYTDVSTGGIAQLPSGIPMYFNAFVTAFTWDYPFLSSPWAFPIHFVLMIVTIGAVWCLVEIGIQVAQGIINGVRTILSV
jgi:hypothetical protein